jgi:hypothetical protein
MDRGVDKFYLGDMPVQDDNIFDDGIDKVLENLVAAVHGQFLKINIADIYSLIEEEVCGFV